MFANRMFLSTKVARRVLALFLLCSVLPIVGLALVSYKQVVRQLLKEVEEETQEASKSVGMATLDRLSSLAAELHLLASIVGASDADSSPIGAELMGIITERFDAVARVSATGAVSAIHGDMRTVPSLSESQREHLKSFKQLITNHRSASGESVLMAVVVDGAPGNSALLWAEVSADYLWGAYYSALTLTFQGDLCVLAEPDVVLQCNQPLPDAARAEYRANKGTANSGILNWVADEQAFVSGYSSIFLKAAYGSPAWTFYLTRSRASALAPLASFRRTFFSMLILTVLVVLFVSNIQVRKSMEPLVKLTDATERIGARDFDHEVLVSSGDEFEGLAASFNSMSSRLRQQFEKSDRLNAALRDTGERLRESGSRLRTILDTTADAIVTVRSSGELESFNATAETVFGYSWEEARGQPFSLLLAEAELEGTAMSAYAGSDRRREILARRKSGDVFPMEFGVNKARLADDTLFVVVMHDITARKDAEKQRAQLEAQLRQAQKMETIGTLAGGIAHDLNNILGPIFIYADLALVDAEPGTEVHEDVTEIKRAATRAKNLVEQVLLFSRRTEHQKQPVDMVVMVKEVLKLIRATLPTTIEIRRQIDCGDTRVMADLTQMHQVLMNLCTNAHHAMRDAGGELEVRLEVVTVGTPRGEAVARLNPGNYLRVTVSDTGCGISPEHLERVFEPFFTTKKAGQGTGLGLSVVHGIVADHGGEITVESELGVGTKFSVFLPVTDANIEAGTDDDASELTGDERILIVDDDPGMAGAFGKALDELGYRTTTHTDSLSALASFEAAPDEYDLIIADRVMPHLTGLELARRITAVRDTIPVMIVTGYGDGLTKEDGPRLGFVDLLLKPFSAADLGRAVRRVMDASSTR